VGWDAWGHRKLAELKRVGIDDVDAGPVSDSTMYRAPRRNGLCLPLGHTSEVRQLAGVRREAFIVPPTRRNRLWQAGFSEFETLGQGVWNLGGVVDYVAKVNLACTVTVTKTTKEAIAFFEAALAEVEVLLGITWIEDLTDPATGEIGKLRIVTDNGPCFKSGGFAAWVASKRHVVHIRTRKKAPWTNGQIERFFGALKYERLYRHDIGDGVALAGHVTDFRTIYNSIGTAPSTTSDSQCPCYAPGTLTPRSSAKSPQRPRNRDCTEPGVAQLCHSAPYAIHARCAL